MTTAPKYKCVLLSMMMLNLFITTKATPTYTASYCTNTSAPNTILDHFFFRFYHWYSLASWMPWMPWTPGYYLLNTKTFIYKWKVSLWRTTFKSFEGLILCRHDVTPTICDQCVTAAFKEIRIRCPTRAEALIWYDECFLRYTDSNFSVDNIDPRRNLDDGNIDSGVDLGRFNQSLYGLLNRLVTETAAAMKFAAGKTAVTESMTLYGMVQCTDELTKSECETCLRNAIGTLPNGKQSARALLPFCNVRYQLYPFSNLSSPPPQSSSEDRKLDRPDTNADADLVAPVIIGIIVLCLACFTLCCSSYSRIRSRKKKRLMPSLMENFGDEIPTLESLQFNLATLEAATNQFSFQNKIGSGGFGEVYKGDLLDGRKIAVKKLSKNSRQGTIQFKNEIVLIAKLQHRNLVTLHGFCCEEQEKMLVYEYVPNKSLDYFLFDRHIRVLSWHERYRIIRGIARGIHYLHDQSRLKVIHRDLKPSNILLDEMMNPKISDFGIARMVDIDQHQGNTEKIVGTYGYMPPEYVMHGQYSEKTDMFSFGVIILEIISSKRNAWSLDSPDFDDLLSYAWKNWRDKKELQVLDSNIDIEKSFCYNEVIKCIQIGLLCVQQNPDDRLTIERVVWYLSSASVELPLPQEPARFMANGTNPSMRPRVNSSVNDMIMSPTFPR